MMTSLSWPNLQLLGDRRERCQGTGLREPCLNQVVSCSISRLIEPFGPEESDPGDFGEDLDRSRRPVSGTTDEVAPATPIQPPDGCATNTEADGDLSLGVPVLVTQCVEPSKSCGKPGDADAQQMVELRPGGGRLALRVSSCPISLALSPALSDDVDRLVMSDLMKPGFRHSDGRPGFPQRDPDLLDHVREVVRPEPPLVSDASGHVSEARRVHPLCARRRLFASSLSHRSTRPKRKSGH
jgi:hypothetical protein